MLMWQTLEVSKGLLMSCHLECCTNAWARWNNLGSRAHCLRCLRNPKAFGNVTQQFIALVCMIISPWKMKRLSNLKLLVQPSLENNVFELQEWSMTKMIFAEWLWGVSRRWFWLTSTALGLENLYKHLRVHCARMMNCHRFSVMCFHQRQRERSLRGAIQCGAFTIGSNAEVVDHHFVNQRMFFTNTSLNLDANLVPQLPRSLLNPWGLVTDFLGLTRCRSILPLAREWWEQPIAPSWPNAFAALQNSWRWAKSLNLSDFAQKATRIMFVSLQVICFSASWRGQGGTTRCTLSIQRSVKIVECFWWRLQQSAISPPVERNNRWSCCPSQLFDRPCTKSLGLSLGARPVIMKAAAIGITFYDHGQSLVQPGHWGRCQLQRQLAGFVNCLNQCQDSRELKS